MSINSIKTFSWKKAILLCLGIGLLVAGLSVFAQTRSRTVQGFRTENSGIAVSIPVTATLADSVLRDTESFRTLVNTGSSFEAPGLPVRILIPAIGVDAAVQSVGLSWKGDGTMGIPTNFTDVAWYNEGPLPGMPGSAVIAGHLDGKKVSEAVFYNLERLKLGDLVKVVDNAGKTLQFRVVDSQVYDYKDSTAIVFSGDISKTRLNLITCTGNWIKSQKLYDKRIVVFTELETTD